MWFQVLSGRMESGVNGGPVSTLLLRLKDQYEVSCSYQEVGESSCVHRFLVLDALISPFCQTKILTDTLSDGSWLLRQLLLHSETEFNTFHLQSLKLLEGLKSSLIISNIQVIEATTR
ncbi:hypothetical protein Lser_V15G00627 [Lactuca serriola]